MKIYLFVLLLLTQFTVFAQESPLITRTFDRNAIKALKVETSGGNITVTGGDMPAKVDVYVRPANNRNKNMSKDELQRKLEAEYELEVSMTGGKLVAIARPKSKGRNWNDALSISFGIFVPKKIESDLVTSGGNIRISGLSEGKQEFTTSGGNLEIDHVGGKVNGTTSGGNITVSHGRDELELTTSGGNIKASDCQGKIKLATSGGSVELQALNGEVKAITSGGNVKGNKVEGSLSAHTSGGNVRLDGLACSLETSTSGGNIDVEIITLGKYVRIDNSGGNIDVSMPGSQGLNLELRADKIKTSTLADFRGEIDERRITGTLHGGGIPVSIKANSGKLNLVLK